MAQSKFRIQPGGNIGGHIQVPGDKSISHRAVILGSLAQGETEVHNFLASTDCLATLHAFQSMGVTIEQFPENHLRIHGVGLHGLKAPSIPLDMGNSGTAMRLMTGVLAAQSFNSILMGDASLQRRPMRRIIDPLMQMGARIHAQENEVPPLEIFGTPHLHGVHYRMPVASAQVKSCMLLAGLYTSEEVAITEPAPTRDHTERMLETFGVPVRRLNSTVVMQGGKELKATTLWIPADISSAAFFLIAACIAPYSELVIEQMGMNPKRTGILNILSLMGAKFEIFNEKVLGNEPIADIRIRTSKLRGIDIPFDQVSLAIDEFPALFIAAACAQGVTVLRGAEELRVKESDRIAVMAQGLQTLGIEAEALPDGIRIVGGKIQGATVNAMGDHRVAMAFAVAGLVAQQDVVVEDVANVATSFPNFVKIAQAIGFKVTQWQ